MKNHWRIWLVGTVLALWLVPFAILTDFNGLTDVALTGDAQPQIPVEQVLVGGFHCNGFTLTVLRFPEPCEWSERPIPAGR